MFCVKCGTQLSESDRFCPECGAPAPAVAQQPAAEAPTFRPAAAPVYQQPAYQQYQQPTYPQMPSPAPAKKQKKWLLPVIIGVLALIAAGLLLYFLVLRPKNAAKTDPEGVAKESIIATIETDSDKISLYVPFNFDQVTLQEMEREYGSFDEFMKNYNENNNTSIKNIGELKAYVHNNRVKDLTEEYGADYQILLTLREDECNVYTGDDIRQKLDDEYCTVASYETLEYVDVSQISELRYYEYTVVVRGSKDTNETWYGALVAKIGNEWKVLDVD